MTINNEKLNSKTLNLTLNKVRSIFNTIENEANKTVRQLKKKQELTETSKRRKLARNKRQLQRAALPPSVPLPP